MEILFLHLPIVEASTAVRAVVGCALAPRLEFAAAIQEQGEHLKEAVYQGATLVGELRVQRVAPRAPSDGVARSPVLQDERHSAPAARVAVATQGPQSCVVP